MQENYDENVLVLKGVCKEFPGVKALADVDLTIRRGEVHALVGENGAGKSTLMKILSGAYKKDGGTILLMGGRWKSVPRRRLKSLGFRSSTRSST